MNQKIKIDDEEFRVIDAKEMMTVPDCFVRVNKIGIGHGEAKFYIGNDNSETRNFFDDFNRKCIFLKSDFLKYLEDAKTEYKNPSQPYIKKERMYHNWENYLDIVNKFPKEIIEFHIEFQSQIKGPRMYISSSNQIYKLVRIISLPNITYLSALKLETKNGKIIYYFKLFLDYFGENEHPSIIQEQVDRIQKNKNVGVKEKLQMIRARYGQGKYRESVLKECPFCPITLISDDRLLIASHIKPWVKSNSKEKLDAKNGFMLTPTYDFLFDRGYISFKDDKVILISPWLSKMTIKKLNLVPGKKYNLLPSEGREKYLNYHRMNIFKK